MFRSLIIAAAAVFISTSASASTVDAFNLDVTTSTGTDSNIVLELGKTYRLTVSGTFSIGSNPTRHVADAEFFNLGSDPLVPLDRVRSREIGVGVNGMDIDFGAYSPDNVYSALIEGTGSTINVFFADSAYRDNSGSLRVEISTIPLPAGMLLLLSGLAGFGVMRRRSR
ncbi:VPLPA-CTERM sorting domain-containing protein [uncultured Roseobacter sp.]|uniref:VPLPA-CTERM sorting domain-containing protein n=1 Tax=uncultured Roseobacter sp. TaxID=114847 RepID=UPI00261012E2|nr:VPLPA-CTERM sorting domain-containing protein [uncultured Roseobacter sp.]